MKTITFFSFKGGVGRSSLLANLGAYWADQGKQVAMMDLDLAAPGLSFLPQRGDHLEPEFSDLGMSDVLSIFEQGLAEDVPKLKLLPPSKLLREVRLPSGSSGSLLLIEAGSSDWQRVSTVSEGLLHNIAPIVPDDASSEGRRQQAWRQLAQAIYEDLSAWRHPRSQQPLDLLLIDCRTGFAELLDFSLSYLTERQDDHLVLVSALNEQNRAGLRLSLLALQQQNRIPVDEMADQVSVVFSPVSISEDEASLQALELGTQVINDCLRLTRSGAKERPPHFFVLHYNQILASSEALLSVTHQNSLYTEEVRKIADWLVGKQPHPDRTLSEISQRVGWEMGWNKPDDGEIPLATSKRYTSKRPNLLSNLPAWYWPLEAPSNAERQQLLDKLIPANPDIALDRETLLNSLAFSPSLSTSKKERILETWPRINKDIVTALLKIFEDERNSFSELSSMYTSWVFTRLHLLLPQWAILLLGDEQQGWQRYVYPPLRDESLFAYAEHWGEYWGGLAGIALARFADKSAAEQALRRVEDTTNSDPASVCLVAIQSGVRAQNDQTTDWQLLADWFTARISQCQDSNSLSKLGVAWNREAQCYAEAEKAYRQALLIEPKSVETFDRLGILLSDNLHSYPEAEQAYRQALKLEPKRASTWHNLGCLHSQLGQCRKALRSWKQALDYDSHNPYVLINQAQLLLSMGTLKDELSSDMNIACQSFKGNKDHARAMYAALALDSSNETRQLLTKLNGVNNIWEYFCRWLYVLCAGEQLETNPNQVLLVQLKAHSEHQAMLRIIYYLAGWRPQARERLQQAAQQLLQMDTSQLSGAPMLARLEQLYTRFAADESNGGGDPRDLPLICNDASNNQQSNQN